MKWFRVFCGLFSLVVLTTCLPTAGRTQPYPSRPIRILVGYAAGSATDVFARTCAKMLEARLGQPVVVENRPGAGALIAVMSVKRAPADGYTLLWVNNGEMSVLPVLQPVDFDPLRDFVPLAAMVNLPPVYVIGTHVPASNMGEFVSVSFIDSV
ncbi:MAG: Bug family tripartite tricarboxylate transporter substrate binding protein, partial [Candidatus Sulfotelmatobacter sp.]